MVIDNSKQVFVCPYCSSQYDTYDEAQECAQDCNEPDSPEEKEVEEYECEMCNKKYDEFNEAYECETKHRKEQDRFFEAYNDRKSKERLLEAGNSPYQHKLSNFVSNSYSDEIEDMEDD